MKYACLIYADESDPVATPAEDTPEFEAMMGGYFAFDEAVGGDAVVKGGEALAPTATATSVQVRDGSIVTTDGPFAETKEQLGGFYLIEATDLDHAISVASKIPHAATGTIEVRPVIDYTAE